MGAPDPNPTGREEPQGRDGPLQGERPPGPDAGGPALAAAAVSDPDEARRFIEAQCCSRWPI